MKQGLDLGAISVFSGPVPLRLSVSDQSLKMSPMWPILQLAEVLPVWSVHGLPAGDNLNETGMGDNVPSQGPA